MYLEGLLAGCVSEKDQAETKMMAYAEKVKSALERKKTIAIKSVLYDSDLYEIIAHLYETTGQDECLD